MILSRTILHCINNSTGKLHSLHSLHSLHTPHSLQQTLPNFRTATTSVTHSKYFNKQLQHKLFVNKNIRNEYSNKNSNGYTITPSTHMRLHSSSNSKSAEFVDKSKWTPNEVQQYLEKFSRECKLSPAQRDALFQSFRTATGKELFDLDLPHLKDRINDPRVAKKLYSYMGGFTASKFIKVMIGVITLAGIPLAIGANLYMDAHNFNRIVYKEGDDGTFLGLEEQQQRQQVEVKK